MIQYIEIIAGLTLFISVIGIIILFKTIIYYKISLFDLFDTYKKYGNIDPDKTSFWRVYVEGVVLFTDLPDPKVYARFYEYEKVSGYVNTVTQCQKWLKRFAVLAVLSLGLIIPIAINSGKSNS